MKELFKKIWLLITGKNDIRVYRASSISELELPKPWSLDKEDGKDVLYFKEDQRFWNNGTLRVFYRVYVSKF